MRFKKTISIILALLTVLALCSCEKRDEESVLPNIDETAQWLVDTVKEPGFGSTGGEWLVIGLARAEASVPDGYFKGYYEKLEKAVIDSAGVLSDKKYTEYSRTVMALTAIGKDPTDVAGFDLLAPLGFYEQTVFQGINGAVYALLALDCGGYDMPTYNGEGTQATRDMYVDYILSKELPDGGWSFAGGAVEADMTGMVLQALANYTDRQDVSEAVDRALEVISALQKESGGFASNDTDSCETAVQVIVALCQLGIDINDKRFVKNGNSLVDRLMDFEAKDGGFAHNVDGEMNIMATEQALYALAAMERVKNNQPSLYDMSDVK